MASRSHFSVVDDFERDIEDAVFETIDVDLDQKAVVNPSKPVQRVTPLVSPSIMRPSSNAGLSVFSSDPDLSPKPVMSQALLTMAVFAFTIAIVLPGIWYVHTTLGPGSTGKGLVDSQIITGSTLEISAGSSASQSPVDDPILMKPNKAIHANKASSLKSEYGNGKGSIVYFRSK